MSAILFSPEIGPVSIDVFLSEEHESAVEMTSIPIEGTADATDHCYALPDRVTIEIASEQAAATYQDLRDWQKERVPFTLVTGLEIYDDMLIERIRPRRDAANSRIFRGTIELRQIIIVETSYIPAGLSDGFSVEIDFGLPGGVDSLVSAALSAGLAIGEDVLIRAARTVMRGVSTTSFAPLVDDVVTGVVNTAAENLAIVDEVFG